MAKKKKETIEEPIVEETVIMEEPVVETPKVKEVKPEPKKSEWEFKDRIYFLNGVKPLTYIIKSANIHWFDEEKGYERELKYCSNQRTCFVDEMKGDQRLEHIIFRSGRLLVPKEKTVLQKLLSLYHPHRDKLYREWKPAQLAANEIDILELEIEALNAAQDLEIDMAEAVMRVEIGSKVSEMSSKELKRDLMLYAKRNPKLFLELVNDNNVMLRNFGIKATELGILRLSRDQRTFHWASSDRKLMTVPFDEHPYSALAAWFKTDEGMEVYRNIEKRLN
tara:strand:+ start:425 stop:1261 length:837 start_codon:yes stop_codon:yes gene_type:complete